MKKFELDANQMGVLLQLTPDGEVIINAGHALTDEFLPEEEINAALGVLEGVVVMLREHPDFLSHFGQMHRELTDIWGEEFTSELTFETADKKAPDTNERPENSQIVEFCKRTLH